MRTIKFLGFAVAMAAVAVPVTAQGNLQPGAFPGIDRLARIEANRLAHQHQLRQLRAQRFGRMQANGRFGQGRGLAAGSVGERGLNRAQGLGGRGLAVAPHVGFRAGARNGVRSGVRAGAQAGFRAGTQAGFRAGAQAGFRAGFRAERFANATPEQKAFVEQLRAQRQSVRSQVLEGKLTREQARAQMQKWVMELRPKK